MAKKTFQEILDSLPEKSTPAKDPFKVLEGANIRKLPFAYWKKNMFFFGGCDRCLYKMTGSFPTTFRKDQKTHPVFLLKKISDVSFKACPCSTKRSRKTRYIHAGCRLELTGNVMDNKSYILDRFSFNLSRDPIFQKELIFFGLVPQQCIRRKQ